MLLLCVAGALSLYVADCMLLLVVVEVVTAFCVFVLVGVDVCCCVLLVCCVCCLLV